MNPDERIDATEAGNEFMLACVAQGRRTGSDANCFRKIIVALTHSKHVLFHARPWRDIVTLMVIIILGNYALGSYAGGASGQAQAPSSLIRLGYEFSERAELGQPLPITVSVASSLTLTSLAGEVYADEGMIVSPEHFSIPDLRPGMTVERTLTVTPFLDGPLRFSVLVQGEADGQVQAGQITVLIPVGNFDRKLTPPDTPIADDSGDAIVSLPGRIP